MIDPLSILIERSWQQFKKYWLLLLVLFLGSIGISFLSGFLVLAIVGAEAYFDEQASLPEFIVNIPVMLAQVFIYGLVMVLLAHDSKSNLISKAVRVFPRMIGLSITMFILFIALFAFPGVFFVMGVPLLGVIVLFLCTALGIFLLPRLYLTPILIAKNEGVFQGLHRSYQLTNKLWWTIIGRVVVVSIATVAPFICITLAMSVAMGIISTNLGIGIGASTMMLVFTGVYLLASLGISFVAAYFNIIFHVQFGLSIIKYNSEKEKKPATTN